MSVYVDAATWPYGRMMMCHMMADTPEELRAMVKKIGVQEKWFQNRASAPHFDICKSKRQQAVVAGAVELLDRQGWCDMMLRVRKSWPRDERGWAF